MLNPLWAKGAPRPNKFVNETSKHDRIRNDGS